MKCISRLSLLDQYPLNSLHAKLGQYRPYEVEATQSWRVSNQAKQSLFFIFRLLDRTDGKREHALKFLWMFKLKLPLLDQNILFLNLRAHITDHEVNTLKIGFRTIITMKNDGRAELIQSAPNHVSETLNIPVDAGSRPANPTAAAIPSWYKCPCPTFSLRWPKPSHQPDETF